MESGHYVASLLHQDWIALVSRQHARAFSDAADDGGPDEDSLHSARRGAGLEIRFGRDAGDAAIDLPAVGIALHSDVDETQAFLRRAGDFVGQQDGSGAGAEDGPLAAELPQRLHQILLAQQLEHRGALAAGDDQAVQAFQVRGGAHFHHGGAGARGRFGMRLEIALQRKHSYAFHGYHPRVCISSPSGSLEMSRPGIPIPNSSLASSSLTGSLKYVAALTIARARA